MDLIATSSATNRRRYETPKVVFDAEVEVRAGSLLSLPDLFADPEDMSSRQ